MEAVEEGDDGVEALRVVVVELVLGLVSLEEDEIEGSQEEEEASNADHVVEKCNICNKKMVTNHGLKLHILRRHTK